MPNKILASILVTIVGIFATFKITVPCISQHSDIFYPALVYKGLLLVLSWTVLSRLGKSNKGLKKSYDVKALGRWLAAAGVITFVASDMILIASMTCSGIKGDTSMAIMATYYTGQLLISLSSIEAFSENDNKINQN